VNRRQQYSLLIVRSDGTRVFRLNLPRRAAVAGVVGVVAAASLFGVLAGDWVELRRLTREARADRALLAEQRKTLDAIGKRIAGLSRDAEAWRELHGRIWDSLGPEAPARAPVAGIGGGVQTMTSSKVARASDLDRLADIVSAEGESLRALDRLMERAGKVIAALPSRWPVRGPVNSEFGRRPSPWAAGSEFHSGLDIGAPHGTPVHAPAAGTVVSAGDMGDHGIGVVIDHGRDVRSHYGHLSRASVKPGQAVTRGALLGFTGNTGRTTGPHLHYEILVAGKPVNPRAFLWE
jgi:murein DD-endopeptidase MepM/ murein hydrolase activator NlpD